MPDEIAVQGGAGEPDAPESKAGGKPETFPREYVEKLRAESKARREEIDALKAAVEKLTTAQAQNANGKELADRLKALEAERDEERKQAAAARHDALKLKVGVAFDLPPELAEVLRGETEDELRAHAEKLKPFVAAPEPEGLRKSRPNTTPAPGGAPAGETDAQRRARLFGGDGSKIFG